MKWLYNTIISLFIVIPVLLISKPSSAQTALANLDLSLTSSSTTKEIDNKEVQTENINFNLIGGYSLFLTRHIALGGEINYSNLSDEDSTNDQFGIGVMGYYFFTKIKTNEISIYGRTGMGYSMLNPENDADLNFFNFNVSLGAMLPIYRNVAIDLHFPFTMSISDKEDADLTIMTFGVYFGLAMILR